MTIETIRLFGALTRERFDVYALAGPANGSARAALMAACLGVPKVAKARAGVNALEAEMFRSCGIGADCRANQVDALADHCRKALGLPVEER